VNLAEFALHFIQFWRRGGGGGFGVGVTVEVRFLCFMVKGRWWR